MNLEEIKTLAGHREVSAWVIKLVQDAVELERERCAKVCEEWFTPGIASEIAAAIRGMKNG